MRVLLVKNITREGPGLIQDLLAQHRIGYDIVDLYKGEKFPDPTRYSALFVMGGPESANDQTAKMKDELLQIRKATDAGIPYLGACLGMQALVKANGGEVRPNPFKEIGWSSPVDGAFFEINLTAEGKSDPLFTGLRTPLRIFHLHSETVDLTDSMVLLATGKFCRNQVVKIGNNAYGLQGHFELNERMYRTWITEDSDLMLLPRRQLEDDYKLVKEEYENTGRKLLTNFLKIAKLI